MTILMPIGTVFVGRIFLNSVLLLLLVNFVSGVRLKLMYISFIKYIRSSLTHFHGFQAACNAAIVHSYHFPQLHQQNKSSKSKAKIRKASNHCKRVLEAAKPAEIVEKGLNQDKFQFPEIWLSGHLANC